jgi:xanthine/uracil permease
VKHDIFDVGIHERLPVSQLLILGFQNLFGMTGMFVFPGLFGRSFGLSLEQIATLYGMTFIVSGFTTILQSVILLRLPVVQGPYAGIFAALLVLGHLPEGGLAAAYGSFFVAALIWCVLSIPLRRFSVVAWFARFLRAPLISGIIVILTMVQVSSVALPNWIGTRGAPGFPVVSMLAGLIAAVVLVAATIWGRTLRRAAVLLALAFGTAFFALYQPISAVGVLTAPLLVVPKVFPFGFAVHADFVLVFLLTLAPASMASIAAYQIVADWGHEPLSAERATEGVFALALGAVAGSVLGSFGTMIYPDNVGLLRSTRIGSRYATLAAGLFLIVLGGSAKFDMLLVLVPLPVLSAVATVLFGIIMMHGMQMLSQVAWDDRKLIAGGMAMLVGLGGLFIAPETLATMPLLAKTILSQPIVSGGIVVAALYALLCSGEPASKPAE